MKIILLHDQVPDNAAPDVSDVLAQLDAVERALVSLGHQAARQALDLDLGRVRHCLAREKPDLVFNLVESVAGLGSLIHLAPALLDSMRIPYTGSRTEAMFLTTNKLLAKDLLDMAEVDTPARFSLENLPDQGLLPKGEWILKSVHEHASAGLDDSCVVRPGDWSQLRDLLSARARETGTSWFAERFVEGREFNLSLLARADGVQVLPAAEIRFVDYPSGKPHIVGYRAKWQSDSFEFKNTPRSFKADPVDQRLFSAMKGLARSCWSLFRLRGYARIDFRVDAANHPWVLEVNANPCLSPDAGFAAAIGQAGIRFETAVERIIAATVRRNAEAAAPV